jgi:hypothetical protein
MLGRFRLLFKTSTTKKSGKIRMKSKHGFWACNCLVTEDEEQKKALRISETLSCHLMKII